MSTGSKFQYHNGMEKNITDVGVKGKYKLLTIRNR